MAVDKLKEGIDKFAKDQRKLEEMIVKVAQKVMSQGDSPL